MEPCGGRTITIAEYVAWRFPDARLTQEQLDELDERVGAVIDAEATRRAAEYGHSACTTNLSHDGE